MTEMAGTVDLAYDHCQRITKEQAKNFYYAFVTLPKRKRHAIYAAYAFCRLCDDIADEELPLEEKIHQLAQTRQKLGEAFVGTPDGPIFIALEDASTEFAIPQEYFLEVLQGVEMDLTNTRYRTFEELQPYCYKVACTVGLICIEVFGYEDPSAKDYAIDLGMAMQLTNILRDIKEDLQRGRIYIPLEEIESFDYSEEELIQEIINEQFTALMAFQVERARHYFEKGKRLLPLLSPRSRTCPAVLHGLYSQILDRIESSGYNVFDRRIGLTTPEKLILTAKLWAESLTPDIPLLRGS